MMDKLTVVVEVVERTSPMAEEAPVMTTTLSSMFSWKKLWKNHSTAWRKERVGHAKASIIMLAGGTTRFRNVLNSPMIDLRSETRIKCWEEKKSEWMNEKKEVAQLLLRKENKIKEIKQEGQEIRTERGRWVGCMWWSMHTSSRGGAVVTSGGIAFGSFWGCLSTSLLPVFGQ